MITKNKLKITTMKKFNTESITLKVNSVKTIDKLDRGGDKAATELKHDALYLLLNSANPLRSEYDFTTSSYEEIKGLRERMAYLIHDAAYLLKSTKKHDIKLDSLKTGCKVTYGQYSYKGHTED